MFPKNLQLLSFAIAVALLSRVNASGYSDRGGYGGSGRVYTAVDVDPVQLQQTQEYEEQQQQRQQQQQQGLGPSSQQIFQTQQRTITSSQNGQYSRSSASPSLLNRFVGVRYAQTGSQQQALSRPQLAAVQGQHRYRGAYGQSLGQFQLRPALVQSFGFQGFGGSFGRNYQQQQQQNQQAPRTQLIHAAVQSRHRLQFRDVPSSREQIAPIEIEVPSNPVSTIQLTFNSQSSPLTVRQEHTPSPGSYQESHSEDEPHRLIHTVHRPIYQEVNEIIQPYRKVTQQVNPVQEEVQTIVARSRNSAPTTTTSTAATANSFRGQTGQAIQGSLRFRDDSSASKLATPSSRPILIQNSQDDSAEQGPSSIVSTFGQAVEETAENNGYESGPSISGTYGISQSQQQQQQKQRPSHRLQFIDERGQATGTIEVDRVGNGVAYKMMTFTMGTDTINRGLARSNQGYFQNQGNGGAIIGYQGQQGQEQQQVSTNFASSGAA